MPVNLPTAVKAYFDGKNARDPERALSGFTGDAVVGDETEKHRGHAEIAAWMAATSARYDELSEPVESRRERETLVVVARVSGNFPGSPANLTYRFAFSGERIVTLEIGS
ncbi:nuclear transport factor 2 family protein [Pseudohoeflea suaedae]|uniref:Nuclear transport factor 2 family protein n=1 Tax=Pseudohoeflea suaedae TaxID=877384 RepID=A0A4R5PQ13_9HYPH|nr:nuclear transport factor 2 family protein [Pseudohoeflea suaedae]TDH39214.1 nuclear transport factor 2 family protein [Pseudohoeflea suaedae]